jgi:hypothetical protein
MAESDAPIKVSVFTTNSMRTVVIRGIRLDLGSLVEKEDGVGGGDR